MSVYPFLFAVGHRYIDNLFDGPVVIEEKVDGSQFSFGFVDGKLRCWSKRVEMDVDAPEGMFGKACETVRGVAGLLGEGLIYHCEYLAKEKHNTCKYGRVPKGNLVFFDVQNAGTHEFLTNRLGKEAVAEKLGIDCVPLLYAGDALREADIEHLKTYFERESFLGGCKIEGVVVKNYNRTTQVQPGMPVIGKFVRPEFKEANGARWSAEKQPKAEFVETIIESLRRPARWNKAIEHLRDDGKLTLAPQDIPNLIKEVQSDVVREEQDQIKQVLWDHFSPQILRGVIKGLPEHFKQRLAEGL